MSPSHPLPSQPLGPGQGLLPAVFGSIFPSFLVHVSCPETEECDDPAVEDEAAGPLLAVYVVPIPRHGLHLCGPLQGHVPSLQHHVLMEGSGRLRAAEVVCPGVPCHLLSPGAAS